MELCLIVEQEAITVKALTNYTVPVTNKYVAEEKIHSYVVV